MQVEEKPDVTYNDVGGCKEQIEKLKEVVETPLLHVRTLLSVSSTVYYTGGSEVHTHTIFCLLHVHCIALNHAQVFVGNIF